MQSGRETGTIEIQIEGGELDRVVSEQVARSTNSASMLQEIGADYVEYTK